MNRQDNLALLREYTQNDSLIRHMFAVESAVRAYARKFGEDEETWGTVGLLHDFDYERWPDPPDHPLKGSAIWQIMAIPRKLFTRSSRMPTIWKTVHAFHSLTKLFTHVMNCVA